jgi:antitoxin (DNA-binding transcriptional repressor) of toxin-antitoxin stability system
MVGTRAERSRNLSTVRRVSISQIEAQLSRMVEVAGRGKPVARLCPLAPAKRERVLGGLEGRLWVPDDFDAPLPDWLLDLFEDR